MWSTEEEDDGEVPETQEDDDDLSKRDLVDGLVAAVCHFSSIVSVFCADPLSAPALLR
jgi:hypothetical protein